MPFASRLLIIHETHLIGLQLILLLVFHFPCYKILATVNCCTTAIDPLPTNWPWPNASKPTVRCSRPAIASTRSCRWLFAVKSVSTTLYYTFCSRRLTSTCHILNLAMNHFATIFCYMNFNSDYLFICCYLSDQISVNPSPEIVPFASQRANASSAPFQLMDSISSSLGKEHNGGGRSILDDGSAFGKSKFCFLLQIPKKL